MYINTVSYIWIKSDIFHNNLRYLSRRKDIPSSFWLFCHKIHMKNIHIYSPYQLLMNKWIYMKADVFDIRCLRPSTSSTQFVHFSSAISMKASKARCSEVKIHPRLWKYISDHCHHQTIDSLAANREAHKLYRRSRSSQVSIVCSTTGVLDDRRSVKHSTGCCYCDDYLVDQTCWAGHLPCPNHYRASGIRNYMSILSSLGLYVWIFCPIHVSADSL